MECSVFRTRISDEKAVTMQTGSSLWTGNRRGMVTKDHPFDDRCVVVNGNQNAVFGGREIARRIRKILYVASDLWTGGERLDAHDILRIQLWSEPIAQSTGSLVYSKCLGKRSRTKPRVQRPPQRKLNRP